MKKSIKHNLKNILDTAVNHREMAGCSMLVLKDGEELFYYDTGYADMERLGWLAGLLFFQQPQRWSHHSFYAAEKRCRPDSGSSKMPQRHLCQFDLRSEVT